MGRKAGEIEGNYTTLCNISQSKKRKDAGAQQNRLQTGINWYGKREVKTPCPPPPPIHFREDLRLM